MTRRRKTWLVLLAAVLLAGGGFAWYWHATAVERRVDALLDEVRDEEPGLLQRWLARLGLAEDRRMLRPSHEVALDLAKVGPCAVPALARALRDPDPSVAPVAALALDELGDTRGFEFLVEALRDKDWQRRVWSAEAMAYVGPRAVGSLIRALNDDKPIVRILTADALGQLGDARAVEPLKELLDDENEEVREVVKEAMKKIRRKTHASPAATTAATQAGVAER